MGGGNDMYVTNVELKTSACTDEECAEEVKTKYGALLATGGVPVLKHSVMGQGAGDRWKILYIFEGLEGIKKQYQVREFLLAQEEVYKVKEKTETYYPPGVVPDPEEENAPPKKKKKKTKRKKHKKKRSKKSEL